MRFHEVEVEECETAESVVERDLAVADRLLANLLLRFWRARQSPCFKGTETAQCAHEDKS